MLTVRVLDNGHNRKANHTNFLDVMDEKAMQIEIFGMISNRNICWLFDLLRRYDDQGLVVGTSRWSEDPNTY